MITLLMNGGPIFTFPMTLIFLINVVLIARNGAYVFGGKFESKTDALRAIDINMNIGVFLIATGILGQLIGLYSAFEAIEQMGTIQPNILAGGLKISSITTLIGFTYFLISFICWVILKMKINSSMD